MKAEILAAEVANSTVEGQQFHDFPLSQGSARSWTIPESTSRSVLLRVPPEGRLQRAVYGRASRTKVLFEGEKRNV
jgi:hypothetical protein